MKSYTGELLTFLGLRRLFRWWLARLPIEEIRSRDREHLYLTRRWVLGSNESRYALMLHQMHRPDDDACHHDHPWAFITLILKGGYWEEITRTFVRHVLPMRRGEAFVRYGNTDVVTGVVRRWNGPGQIHYRPAEHTHRIDALPNGNCWTLVFRYPKTRSWGFHTRHGWKPWRYFIDNRSKFGIFWCGRRP